MALNIIDIIKDNGIVGAGGAGFPTHVKFNTNAEIVIVNGAECEPLLRVDQQLMAQYPEKLLKGLNMMVEQTGAKKGVVALKAHYHDAVSALKSEIGNWPKLELFMMDNFYPAGDEQVMVYEVTGRIIPEGGIPINVGVVVSNVETILNIVNACENNEPVIYTWVTVTGEIRERKTLKVPVGMKVSEVLALCGGPLPETYVIINGGPMMGKMIRPEDPVTKTVKGLIVLPADHPLADSLTKDVNRMLNQARTSCMNCSLCSEVCPRGMLGHRLEPHKLMRLVSYGKVCDPKQSAMNAFLCCGCRLCEYACVMGLQPWNVNVVMKGRLAQAGVRNELNAQPETVSPFRQFRRFPIGRLISRLGLKKYNLSAPMSAEHVDANRVIILLRQHVGAPAIPVVKTGDTVKRGDCIAQIKEGSLGANLHASIGGTVKEVSDTEIIIER